MQYKENNLVERIVKYSTEGKGGLLIDFGHAKIFYYVQDLWKVNQKI